MHPYVGYMFVLYVHEHSIPGFYVTISFGIFPRDTKFKYLLLINSFILIKTKLIEKLIHWNGKQNKTIMSRNFHEGFVIVEFDICGP